MPPDREPHPKPFEVIHVYQCIRTRWPDGAGRRVEIENAYDFVNLRDFVRGEWRLTADGQLLQAGLMSELHLAPRERMQWCVPIRPFAPSSGTEYFLELRYVLNRPTAWASQGHEMAWDQFRLPDAVPPAHRVSPARSVLTIHHHGEWIRIAGRKFFLELDRSSGQWISWVVRDLERPYAVAARFLARTD
ncbi:MAG: DUF4981 domain-containing protein [Verrucomicrobiota bacterium]|nr:DUF4981 domain-containing protein [Limisphaera sp.]MDW8380650.1 DUF4981 domain-containing protein [Verrucomicrobiota bacterium]